MPLPTPTNLYNFRTIIGNYARPHLFLIEIPALEDNLGSGDPSRTYLTCFARSAKLPDYKVQTTDIEYQGLKYKVATVADLGGTMTMDFLCDERHIVRKQFLKWLNIIYDVQNQNVAGSVYDYKADNVKISQLNRLGQKMLTYTFVGLFPTSCGEINFSHSETAPLKFTVEFAYDYFHIEYGINDGNATSIDRFLTPGNEQIKENGNTNPVNINTPPVPQ